MGLFDDMFGDLFDFNGDGKTDFMESVLGYHIMEEMDDRVFKDVDDDEDDYDEDDY